MADFHQISGKAENLQLQIAQQGLISSLPYIKEKQEFSEAIGLA